MGLDAMIFIFWMLSFKPTFSLSSFTFIKRLLWIENSLIKAKQIWFTIYLGKTKVWFKAMELPLFVIKHAFVKSVYFDNK